MKLQILGKSLEYSVVEDKKAPVNKKYGIFSPFVVSFVTTCFGIPILVIREIIGLWDT